MRDPHIDQVLSECRCSRRDFLRRGLLGVGVGATLPTLLENTSLLMAADELTGNEPRFPNRIMVVIEQSGGNDGLNTVVPYADDAYYRARPTIGIAQSNVRKVSDRFGFHPSLVTCERLFQEGQMAVIHGCGYPNPNFSHFTSMEFWHTGVPNGGDSLGWVGRVADKKWPQPLPNLLVNVGPIQKRAVASRVHAPIVFNEPDKFVRLGTERIEPKFNKLMEMRATDNPTLSFLRSISDTAAKSSQLVKNACAEYRSQTNYGSAGNLHADLRRVAALVAGEFATRIYYVSTGGWDTHANQVGTHQSQLGYLDDAINGFLIDMKKLGRADDVAILLFTEFGRRVEENASGGTDHGTAGPMYIVGTQVKGGFYGEAPSLTDLDNGNLRMTVDFRRVYATMIKEWMGCNETAEILKGDFPTLGVFG